MKSLMETLIIRRKSRNLRWTPTSLVRRLLIWMSHKGAGQGVHQSDHEGFMPSAPILFGGTPLQGR